MKRSGSGSIILLTGFYWISNLIVGIWIGGLLAARALFTLPLDVLQEGAKADAIVLAAETAVGMIDKLRPFIVAAAIVLITSVVLSAALERRGRHSVGWWMLWLFRSIASVAMVAVAFYSLGEIDGNVSRLERDIASLRNPANPLIMADSTSANAAGAAMPGATLPGSRAFGGATPATVRASFHDLYRVYTKWTWIEFALGAFILLAGSFKEAAWRHSWVAEHAEASPRESAEGPAEPEAEESPPRQEENPGTTES